MSTSVIKTKAWTHHHTRFSDHVKEISPEDDRCMRELSLAPYETPYDIKWRSVKFCKKKATMIWEDPEDNYYGAWFCIDCYIDVLATGFMGEHIGSTEGY